MVKKKQQQQKPHPAILVFCCNAIEDVLCMMKDEIKKQRENDREGETEKSEDCFGSAEVQ